MARILLYLWFALSSGSLLAQVGTDPNYDEDVPGEFEESFAPPADVDVGKGEDEDISNLPPDVAEDDEDDDDELSMSTNELRDRFTYGLALNLGTANLRELFGFTYYFLYDKDWVISSNVGTGSWVMDGEQSRKTYRLKATTRDIAFGARYFFTDVTAFYVGMDLSYLFWKGTVDPTGTDATDEDEEVSARLTSSFSVSGPALGLKLGWTALWENGFYVDYCLFGVAKPFLVSEDHTKSASEAKSAVRRELQTPQIWGLVNVSLGWFF